MEVRDKEEQQREAVEEAAGGEQTLAEVSADELGLPEPPPAVDWDKTRLRALVEAVIYMTEEPLSAQQIAQGLQLPVEEIEPVLADLVEFYNRPESGLAIRELAGGYKMSTRAEHHEALRTFVKKLKPPLKLSLPALETLAVIAYKQPITTPEIMEIRGVQGAGVLKTLLDRKLITTAGRKQVVGKPVLYKTTREFLIQFGLKDVSELPTLKEFEELSRIALGDGEEDAAESSAEPEAAPSEEQGQPTTEAAADSPSQP
jgi:segregation and condensation protein B